MTQASFLDPASRQVLIGLARSGRIEHRVARRANALLLLDKGHSCAAVSDLLFIDDDTVRHWYNLYCEQGVEALSQFDHKGSACRLDKAQQQALKAWVGATLPRSTREIGAWISAQFGINYEGRSGLIALLHRLGLAYRKPRLIPRQVDEAQQAAFIKAYDALQRGLLPDETIVFADAAHPVYASKSSGCWSDAEQSIALEQTSSRQRLNIHGALDLETGKTCIHLAPTIDAASTIALLEKIKALLPSHKTVYVVVDNARYHHARIVVKWLKENGNRIKLIFLPPYCPHLNAIERLWGVMHKNVTHNRCYGSFEGFKSAIIEFLETQITRKWELFCDQITDNFRIVSQKQFRVIK